MCRNLVRQACKDIWTDKVRQDYRAGKFKKGEARHSWQACAITQTCEGNRAGRYEQACVGQQVEGGKACAGGCAHSDRHTLASKKACSCRKAGAVRHIRANRKIIISLGELY
jgi:hypothetical protein